MNIHEHGTPLKDLLPPEKLLLSCYECLQWVERIQNIDRFEVKDY